MALSIVAGQPVSVHAPARACRTCRLDAGRLVRAQPIVAYGSRLTRDQSSSPRRVAR